MTRRHNRLIQLIEECVPADVQVVMMSRWAGYNRGRRLGSRPVGADGEVYRWFNLGEADAKEEPVRIRHDWGG